MQESTAKHLYHQAHRYIRGKVYKDDAKKIRESVSSGVNHVRTAVDSYANSKAKPLANVLLKHNLSKFEKHLGHTAERMKKLGKSVTPNDQSKFVKNMRRNFQMWHETGDFHEAAIHHYTHKIKRVAGAAAIIAGAGAVGYAAYRHQKRKAKNVSSS